MCIFSAILLGGSILVLGLLPHLADAADDTPLFYENFSVGYQAGFLGGQQGWRGTRLQITPVVTTGDEENIWQLSPLKSGVDHQAELQTSGLSLASADQLVLEMIARADPTANYGLYFGVGGTDYRQPTAYFGLSSKGVHVRGATYAGKQSFAVTSEGKPLLTNADRMLVRSVWNLQSGEAKVFIKNLNQGETVFRQVYFDAEQQIATAPIGNTSDSATWAKIYLRMSGSPACSIEMVSIYITKSPSSNNSAHKP